MATEKDNDTTLEVTQDATGTTMAEVIDAHTKAELARFNPFTAAMDTLRKRSLELVIKDEFDKEGFEAMQRFRLDELRDTRIEMDKLRKSIVDDAVKFQRTVNQFANPLIDQLEALEAPLKQREAWYKAKLEERRTRAAREKAEKTAARTKRLTDAGMVLNEGTYSLGVYIITVESVEGAEDVAFEEFAKEVEATAQRIAERAALKEARVKELFGLGMTFNGTAYLIGEVSLTAEDLDTCSTEEYDELLAGVKAEAERLADLKKQEDERKAEDDRKQRELKAENDRKQKELDDQKAEQARQSRELKAREDAALLKERGAELRALGATWSDDFQTFTLGEQVVGAGVLVGYTPDQWGEELEAWTAEVGKVKERAEKAAKEAADARRETYRTRQVQLQDIGAQRTAVEDDGVTYELGGLKVKLNPAAPQGVGEWDALVSTFEAERKRIDEEQKTDAARITGVITKVDELTGLIMEVSRKVKNQDATNVLDAARGLISQGRDVLANFTEK